MPFGRSLAIRKADDLEEVSVRVAEIERADSSGIRVPVRKPLRSRRCVLDLVHPKALVGFRNVAHHDRDVLEHSVVRTKVVRDGSALRRQILGQLDLFGPEAKPDNAGTSAKDAGQQLVLTARQLDVRYL